MRKQWRIQQRSADMVWKRWVHEYLSTLTRRTKWHYETMPRICGREELLLKRFQEKASLEQWTSKQVMEYKDQL